MRDVREDESEDLAQLGSAWAIRLYERDADEKGKFVHAACDSGVRPARPRL